jgi:N-acetylglucosamine-6-sulfatase/beta-glucosidase
MLLFLGDSITDWWDKDIYERDFSKYENENLGIGGLFTHELIKILQHGGFMNKYKPKVVVLMIGINNLLTGSNPEHVINEIRAIIDIILSKYPGVKILLRGLLPCGKFKHENIRTKVEDVNNVIMTYANGDNIFYIDNGDLFKDSEGTLDEKLMYDYLHFTKEGYEVMSNGLSPTICELMDN